MRRLASLTLRVGIGMAVSIVCALLVLRVVDLRQVTDLLANAALPLVPVAVAATSLDIVLRAWRWRVLVSPLSIVPMNRVLSYLLVGYLANNVLPGRAGELVRSHYLGDREGASRLSILGTVFVERILDVVTLLALTTVAWWMTGASSGLAGLLIVGLLGGVLAVVAVIAVVTLPGERRYGPTLMARIPLRVRTLGGRLRAGVAAAAAPRTILTSVVLTLLAWTATAAVFAAAASAIGFRVSPGQVLLIAGATNLATAIPSAPGYVGTFEFAVVATAGAIGLAMAPALAMAVLVHAVVLLTTTLGGLAALYFVTYRVRTPAAHAAVAREDPNVRGEPQHHLPPG